MMLYYIIPSPSYLILNSPYFCFLLNYFCQFSIISFSFFFIYIYNHVNPEIRMGYSTTWKIMLFMKVFVEIKTKKKKRKREPLRFVNVMERSYLQYLSKTFTCSSKVTLPNISKGLVKVTFPSHLQYLNGSLSKSLRSLKVYFRAVR